MKDRFLLDHHRSMLVEESGITPLRVIERNYWSATESEQLLAEGFSEEQSKCVPALMVPMWGVDGEIVLYQARPDNPRTDADGRPLKYETPAGAPMQIDVGPGDLSWLSDPKIPGWITEGIRKVDSAACRGLRVIGLAGVWSWRGTNDVGGSTELAAWEKVAIKDRTFYIAFDSDVMTKREVAGALRRLAGMLKRRGAKVIAIVPPQKGEGKTGLDDFFVAGGTTEELLRASRPELLDVREIVANQRSLSELGDEALGSLVDYNNPPRIFVRDEGLVTVQTGINGEPIIRPICRPKMADALSRSAKWVNLGPKRASETFPPKPVVDNLLSRGDWPDIPPLVGIARTPILSPSGALADRPGYDSATGYLVALDGSVEDWAGDARSAARFLLDEVLVDFPFKDDGGASQAHAISLMLMPILRPAIDGPTPLHMIDAPERGSGKSLLARVCLGSVLGLKIVGVGEAKDEEEWRKKLMTLLLGGRPYIFLDNLEGTLASPNLAGMLTGVEWGDRLLGTMREVIAPVRCAWVATSNNVRLSSDIARRSAYIRLDAMMEAPSQRTGFRHPAIEAWCRANRSAIVSALVRMVRDWVEAGKPRWKATRLGSFEEWGEILGGVLQVAGVRGFLGNVEDLAASANPQEGNWSDFYARWFARHGSKWLKAGELVPLFVEDEDLVGLLSAQMDQKAANLGKLLSSRVGVVRGGLRVERSDTPRQRSFPYKIVAVDGKVRGGTPLAEGSSEPHDNGDTGQYESGEDDGAVYL